MKNKQTIFIIGMILLLIATTALSYGYFEATVGGNTNANDMVVETGTLKLTYTDGSAINTQNIKPGWSTTKIVSVKNNGTLDINYNIIWQSLTNTIINNELVISATCQRLNASGTVEGTCESISQSPIKETTISKNISIESGITHKYTFTILFKEINADQNYNQGKEFNGVLGIEESKEDSSNIVVNCTYNGDLTAGATFTQGNFTYRYKEKMYNQGGEIDWHEINDDGWGVILTNPNSTDSIDASEVCTFINGKPIVSMSFMFANSKSNSINLSNLNTSNVIYMDYMFKENQAKILDLSNFDTSNVTDMSWMFFLSAATTLNLSSFDTSKVISMQGMFAGSQATTLDLSSFNTINVTDMSMMFQYNQATTITGLNIFNTSNVTTMEIMFNGSQAISLDLSSFDTSNVIYMNSMFEESQVTILDLSSFDTSKVGEMSNMFANSPNLKTIYVSSNSFYSDSGEDMFLNCTNLVGGAGTTYDESNTGYEYACIDHGEDEPGYFTDIADKK